MGDVTGTWNLHRAVWRRWTDAGLDAVFKAEWEAADRNRFSPLSDSEAPPGTPWPYAVATIERDIPHGHSTGVGDTDTGRRYASVQLQIAVYAHNTDAEDGKQICERLLVQICDAFDPKSLSLWQIADDFVIRIDRIGDNPVPEDDEVWSWTVVYEIRLDQTMLRPHGA